MIKERRKSLAVAECLFSERLLPISFALNIGVLYLSVVCLRFDFLLFSLPCIDSSQSRFGGFGGPDITTERIEQCLP